MTTEAVDDIVVCCPPARAMPSSSEVRAALAVIGCGRLTLVPAQVVSARSRRAPSLAGSSASTRPLPGVTSAKYRNVAAVVDTGRVAVKHVEKRRSLVAGYAVARPW